MTGNIEGGIDALNLLKPFLTNGQLKCILATTPAEVSLLSKDKAFMRRFSVLRLNHLNLEQQSQAIRIKGKDLFDFHGVKPFLEIFSFVDDFFLRKKIGLDLALDFIDEVLSELSINKFKKLDDTFLQKRFKKFKKMRDLSIDRRKF
jgi:ATP-dependent Clp protease ATP-binding subunit ClpA